MHWHNNGIVLAIMIRWLRRAEKELRREAIAASIDQMVRKLNRIRRAVFALSIHAGSSVQNASRSGGQFHRLRRLACNAHLNDISELRTYISVMHSLIQRKARHGL
jgi:hypothetical protein